MLNQLINDGEKQAQKAQTNYKHVAYIVRGKKILACEVNKYGPEKMGRTTTYHAEECALLHNQHPRLRTKSKRKRAAQGKRRFSRVASTQEERPKLYTEKFEQKSQRVLCRGRPICIPLQANAQWRMGNSQLQTVC
jgi:pyrimidine deaminase RibD-like protein